MLIVQSLSKPGAIRHAIADLVEGDLCEIRIASAYITLGGSRLVYDAIAKCVGPNNAGAMRKRIITTFDFGLTQPQALKWWMRQPNSEIHVAGAEALERGRLIPSHAAFHPKVYAFERRNGRANLLAGSANMTGRGLSANTEAALMVRGITRAEVARTFAAIQDGTRLLDRPLLDQYIALRTRHPPPPELRIEIELLPLPKRPRLNRLPLFWDEIGAGRLRPEFENQMWIEARRFEGGSGNQLELPRGAHRFFGFDFTQHDSPRNITIGQPVLVAGRKRWTDRKLSWHGDNMMERINLPTEAQGGYKYRNNFILFRRRPHNVFELVVSLAGSDLARAWLAAATKSGKIYRIGQVTERLAGFVS